MRLFTSSVEEQQVYVAILHLKCLCVVIESCHIEIKFDSLKVVK